MRELVVLGTSSQVPTRYRNHNGYFLRWDNEGLLFDPGEGTQRQMVRAGVTASMVTRVLITHFHGDHCLGMGGLAQLFTFEKVDGPVHLYYPASGRAFLERMENAAIHEPMTRLERHPIKEPGIIHQDDRITLRAMRLSHSVETFGYRLEAKATDSQPAQSAALVMDTRFCAAAIELAKGVDMLICESTYLASESREARDHGHMTATEAARVAKEAQAKQLVLTHFSQRYPSTKPFLDEARATFKNTVAARDARRYEVSR